MVWLVGLVGCEISMLRTLQAVTELSIVIATIYLAMKLDMSIGGELGAAEAILGQANLVIHQHGGYACLQDQTNLWWHSTVEPPIEDAQKRQGRGALWNLQYINRGPSKKTRERGSVKPPIY